MHKVWLYAPGENASKWDVCLSQNIMCIGWDEMGNLLEYASKKEMAARLQEIYDKPEASFKNDSLALWEFAHEMQAGDIVIVKKYWSSFCSGDCIWIRIQCTLEEF